MQRNVKKTSHVLAHPLSPLRPALAPQAPGLFDIAQRLADYIRRKSARRRAERDLGELDDRILHDIGLSRSDIMRAAQYGFSADERRGMKS